MSSRFTVPCNGCTACCRSEWVFLYPDKGDQTLFYKTRDAINPATGQMGKCIEHKMDGSCVYLGKQGCTIYAMQPHACRVFDCRNYWRSLDPPERKRRLKAGDALLAAAKERL